MAGKVWKKSPEALVETFYEAIKGFENVEQRKMFGYPCAFINGNMWVGLHEDNFAVRLEAKNREEALESGLGDIFAPMKGRVMKEYVALAKEVVGNKKELKKWLKLSHKYVSCLPVKAKK